MMTMVMMIMMIFRSSGRVLTVPYLRGISPQISSNHLLLTFSITLIHISYLFQNIRELIPRLFSASIKQYWPQILQQPYDEHYKANELPFSGALLPLYVR